jgi:hypothetical protein
MVVLLSTKKTDFLVNEILNCVSVTAMSLDRLAVMKTETISKIFRNIRVHAWK